MSIQSVNPATGQEIRTYEATSPAEVEAAIEAAHAAHRRWRETSFDERGALMRAAAAVLRDRLEPWSRLMADEMGTPVSPGRSELEKCAWVCEYYADHAAEFLADEPIDTEFSKSFVAYEPLGVVLAVMPWNVPFWQVLRFAAPALMAGNAGILKHASNVPGCALAIEQIFAEAGFPKGLFRTLLIGSDGVQEVIEHPLVRAVTLTGSTPAGRAVAAAAGRELKKTVLELGGSDAYVVLEDADLDAAVETCVTSRLINSGQSCIAAKRFVVVDAVRERFEERMVELIGAKIVGDPLEESTDVGPMARADLRDELHDQVRRSVEAGAVCKLGGSVPEGPGAFYPPTVLTDVAAGTPAYVEEMFGPVASIIPVGDAAEAIRVANDSEFGLGAAVFTSDVARGEAIAARQLEAGACFVNDFVKSDPRLPFGGIKTSGYGRELSSFGIREFVNIKSVVVA